MNCRLVCLSAIAAITSFATYAELVSRDIGDPEMNAWEGESRIVSVVMEIRDNVNTFRLKRSEPDTSSYAKNIAEKYGITYEQLKET